MKLVKGTAATRIFRSAFQDPLGFFWVESDDGYQVTLLGPRKSEHNIPVSCGTADCPSARRAPSSLSETPNVDSPLQISGLPASGPSRPPAAHHHHSCPFSPSGGARADIDMRASSTRPLAETPPMTESAGIARSDSFLVVLRYLSTIKRAVVLAVASLADATPRRVGTSRQHLQTTPAETVSARSGRWSRNMSRKAPMDRHSRIVASRATYVIPRCTSQLLKGWASRETPPASRVGNMQDDRLIFSTQHSVSAASHLLAGRPHVSGNQFVGVGAYLVLYIASTTRQKGKFSLPS